MLALLMLSQPGLAQQVPDAGSQLQLLPRSPTQPQNTPDIQLNAARSLPPSPGDGQKMAVRSVRIRGAAVFTEAQLLAAAGWSDKLQALSLADLHALAARVTQHYRAAGYFLAQAYLPPQDIRDGQVTISVLEGQYGDVQLRNRSEVSQRLLDGLLQGVKTGDVVTLAPLERGLLLLSDLPGVAVRSTLTPGASVGASDLIVEVDPAQRFTGSVEADNHGSRYTGSQRVGATVNVNNLAGVGDVLTLRALSTGRQLNYGRLAYQVQVGAGRVGTSYADMNYALGREFESLQFAGGTQITSVYGSYPLQRSRQANASLQLSYDAKAFQDRQGATSTANDKRAKVWTGSIVGDHRDAWRGGGFDQYSASVTQGRLDAPLTEAHADGRYTKLALSASRLQSLTPQTSVQISLSAQVASKNLDSSEKMELGGAQAVRAYPQGEAYGDQGYVVSLEGRTLLPRLFERQSGQLQLVGFVDTGTVYVNKNRWDASDNRRTLSGVGIGVNWMGDHDVVVKAYCARKVGAAVANSAPDASTRFWIQAVKYF